MAPNPKDTNMADGLKKLLGDIAQLQTAPDADVQFLTTLQQAVTQKIREGMQAQGQPQPPGAQPSPSGPSGMAGANPGAMTGLSATGSGGTIDMGAGAAPNMDEMNRALGSSSGAQ